MNQQAEYILMMVFIAILIIIALVLLGESLRVRSKVDAQPDVSAQTPPTRIASGSESYAVDFDSDPEVYPITPPDQHIISRREYHQQADASERWRASKAGAQPGDVIVEDK